jgi:hypothetical protein
VARGRGAPSLGGAPGPGAGGASVAAARGGLRAPLVRRSGSADDSSGLQRLGEQRCAPAPLRAAGVGLSGRGPVGGGAVPRVFHGWRPSGRRLV